MTGAHYCRPRTPRNAGIGRSVALVVFIALCAFMPSVGLAQNNLAMLVGVSSYPTLAPTYALNGPQNDIVLVRDVLTRLRPRAFRPEDIITLADGVDGAAGLPTRAAILAGFGRLSATAKRGDFVYLHFSGHGSQQPEAVPGSEPDGLDETFLPIDVGQWDDKAGKVDNALVDDEIREAINAIRAKGAFVFAVFDSCHSGTVTRAAPVSGADAIRLRRVDPAMLGIPERRLEQAEVIRSRGLPDAKTSWADLVPGPVEGGLVVFSAAQSNETAPEMRLPAGMPGRQPHGLLTFTLYEIFAAHPDISYRRAGQELLQRYAAKLMSQPTPVFEGDLGETIFGGLGGLPTAQWPVLAGGPPLRIAAGQIHGLSPGDRLAVMPAPGAGDAEAIGEVVIAETSALTSTLAGSSVPDNAYVRRLRSEVRYGLTVALPEIPADAPGASARELREALDRFAAPDDSGLRIAWVRPGEPADLRLAYYLPVKGERDRLWLLPPTGMAESDALLDTVPTIRVSGRSSAVLAGLLADSLASVGRVANLLRLGTTLGHAAAALDVKLLRRRPPSQELSLIETAAGPLRPGEEIHLEAINATQRPMDINVLYIASDYSIAHVLRERIEPRGKLRSGIVEVTASSYGAERVVVIAVPAAPMTEILDLSFLEQKALPATRGAGSAGLAGQLREAGFGTVTRGGAALGRKDGEQGAILQFGLTVAPR